ncbi:MAG: serine/threonine-protein kinase, partial [Limisphaerales bacterium]
MVSGPPESPVALLDKLRKSLEAPAARSHQSVSRFVLGSLKKTGITTEAIAAVVEELEQEKAGPYELDRIIATGGMGAIISAVDQNLRRDVAIKVILNAADAKPELIQRLVTEARITGQLEHPNIVPLHELGVTGDGIVYYTMQLVDGITLNEVLQKIREGDADTLSEFPLHVLLTAFQKVCDAVAYAHSRGVVHRDLKPDNVMLGEFGEVMVMDWGLAKVLGPSPEEEADSGDSLPGINDDTYQTLSGRVKGTPRYMAPEQALGHSHEIDERTDIYALGAILYGILTLHPPVTGESVDEVLKRAATGAIPSPTAFNTHSSSVILEASGEKVDQEIRSPMLDHCPDRRIPGSLSAVAMKALARQKPNRYESVAELQKEIEAYQHGFATAAESAGALRLMWLLLRRHRTESILVTAALVTIVALVVWFTS